MAAVIKQGYPQISTWLLVRTVVSNPTPDTNTVPPTKEVILLEVGTAGLVLIVLTSISYNLALVK